LVLPCFNEERNIERTVRLAFEWIDHAHPGSEVIVVDDGSRDRSRDVLQRLQREFPSLVVLTHDRNRGYGATVRDGCDRAARDVIAFMDSDGQFQPVDIDRLLARLNETEFVAGRREHRADPPLRRLTAFLYGLLVRITLGIRLRDINCGMKAFTRRVWRIIRPTLATGALINAEIFARLQKNGIPWTQVDVPHYPRLYGKPTGLKPRVVLRMFRELQELKRAMT
jgi:glycosyltransferase involved in cell wall biosynthesis